jgi:ATP-dependent RNA helicase DDX35
MGPDEATIISLEGRMFPVEVAYLREPAPDYVHKAAEVACELNAKVSLPVILHVYSSCLNLTQQGLGDVLIFLTGREEIDRCLEELSEMIPQ